jgi:hypothetical protein
MSFLALPFTFPILVICALAGYPIYAVGRALIENAIAFFTLNRGLSVKLSIRERIAVVSSATFYDVRAAFRSYGRALVNGAKRTAAWLAFCVVTFASLVLVGLGFFVGLVTPLLAQAFDSIRMGIRAGGDVTEDALAAASARVVADVSR